MSVHVSNAFLVVFSLKCFSNNGALYEEILYIQTVFQTLKQTIIGSTYIEEIVEQKLDLFTNCCGSRFDTLNAY